MHACLQRRQRNLCLAQPCPRIRDAVSCIRAVSTPQLHEQHALSDVLRSMQHMCTHPETFKKMEPAHWQAVHAQRLHAALPACHGNMSHNSTAQ